MSNGGINKHHINMNKKKLIYVAIAAVTIVFTACKKDNDESPKQDFPANKESIIANKTWILDSSENGVSVTESMAKFNSDKTFTNETMMFKPISNGKWEISGDTLVLDRRLFNNGNFNPTRYKIETLTREKLVLVENFKTSLTTKVIKYYYIVL